MAEAPIAPGLPAQRPAAASATHVAWPALKMFAAGLGLLLVSTLCARTGLRWVQATSSDRLFFRHLHHFSRQRAMLDQLPTIAAAPEQTSFLVGSSLTQFGFSPRVFDAQAGANGFATRSYNFGVVLTGSDLCGLLLRRMEDAYRRAGRRAALTMIEFTPNAMTRRFGRDSRSLVVKRALLMTPGELGRLFFRAPGESSQLLSLKILGGIGAGESNMFLGKRFIETSPGWWPGPVASTPPSKTPELDEARRALSEAVMRHYHDAPPPWEAASGGEWRVRFPETEQLYAEWLRQMSKAMPNDLERARADGAEELPMDPDVLDGFIDSVRTARRFSDRVAIVLMPQNSALLHPTPAGRERLARALERFRAEAGVPIIDLYGSAAFTSSDFQDLHHLNELVGRAKLSRMLADEITGKAPGPTQRVSDE